MKILLHQDNTYILTVDRDEEFISTLTTFCEENSIKAGWLTALGACGELTLAWYNLETKEYEDHEYGEDLEIASLLGNIAIVDDKSFIHAHGIFGRRDMSTIGGHIKNMKISATCEVKLDVYDDEILREYDDVTGLKLMGCKGNI